MFLLLFVTLGLAANSSMAQTAADVGEWKTLLKDGSPLLMPINPIHAGLLHNGKVLFVAGSGNDLTQFDEKISQFAVWDPQSGTITVQNVDYDLFCNGMAFLPDGRALIIGGTETYDPFFGDARASIFDPATEKLVQVQSMQHGRWYATATALSDGQVMTFSGFDEHNFINQAVEIYKIAFGWSPEALAPWTPPLYPWLHLLPDGKVFYSGATPGSRIFDPGPQTWSDVVVSTASGLNRHYGSSVLLPLRPPNYTPRVMILGGADIDSNPNIAATDTTEIIDLSNATPTWQSGQNMSAPRIHMNAVLLPNGKVLALGGSKFDEDTTTASHAADLFDPAVQPMKVAPAGVAAFDRFYHSMGLLLPDATVWVAGSNPNRGVFEPHVEIYSPPYLFNPDGSAAPRPTILSAPSTPIGYGADFHVQIDTNISANDLVVFIRPGSPTHAFDMEQRLVGLTFTPGTDDITVTSPPNANIAPPGYYMLFVVKDGVPSVAKFIQLSSIIPTTNKPPKGTITLPATDVTIQAGQSVTFAGTGSDSDGSVTGFSWVFPDGAPDSSTDQNPGPVTFSEAGTHVISLTVVDNLGDNDPSPPTRTITVVVLTPVTLTIAKTGPGSGKVTSNPAGIDCGSDCSEIYNSGASVTLTATADSGSTFNGWSGGWCSGTGTCVPTLNSDTTVTANFIITPVTLDIAKTGTGSGTVTSNPAGIDCGATCSKVYNFGDSVTLTAAAAAGSVFGGWSGDCSGSSPCTLTIGADTAVTATFIPSLTRAALSLSMAEVGVTYSAPLVTGGSPLYTFTLKKGTTFPGGLTPDTEDGTLHGVPTTAALKGKSFTVQITDQLHASVQGTFKITIKKLLNIATTSLPTGTQGIFYKKTLSASGGKTPYSWSEVSGNLPGELTLNPSTGVISGTPSPSSVGSHDLTFKVTDPLVGEKEKSFTLTIN